MDRVTTQTQVPPTISKAGEELDQRLRRADVRDFFDALIEVDCSGAIRGWNPQAAALFGRPDDEVLNRNFCELIVSSPGRDVYCESMGELRSASADQTRRCSLEIAAVHRDGHEFPAILNILIPAGGSICTIAVVAGVCVRKSSENKDAAHHAAMNELSESYIEFDLKGNYLFVNKRYTEVFGFQPAQRIGRSAHSVLSPEQRKLFKETYQEVLKTGELKKIEGPLIRSDGVTLYCEQSISLRRDSQGMPVGFGVIVWDVSERKRNQMDLAKAKEDLSLIGAMVDSSQEAIWCVDMNRNIMKWNAGAQRMFGYTAEEVIGRPALEVFRTEPEEQAKTSELLQRGFVDLIQGKPVTFRELHCLDKSGKTIHHDITFSPIVQNRKLLGVSGIARDITERKRNEEALKQAKEAAEAGTRAKSEFLANMSHEIRTPLNGIIGMLELAGYTQLTAEQKELLDMSYSSAKSLLLVINDILDFSKIEAGKMSFERHAFNLAETANQAVGTLSIIARNKGLDFKVAVAPGTPQFLFGDSLRLKQVMLNLMGNSIKFTRQGHVELRIALLRLEGGKAELQFSVSDTGIGIPEDKQKLIFEAFSQVDVSTSRKFGGTGLGLTISTRIVQMMGGRIWVESEADRGSTFHFTAVLEVADGASAEKTLAAVKQELKQTGPLKVLLAEDNPINQKLAVRLLERMGHQVTVANNGVEALAKLEEEALDLVLMDVQMPEMDGFAATALIRASEGKRYHHIPIIAMTAHAMQGDRERCLEKGMNDYISKPIGADVLKATIARTVQARP